jgi:fatty acid desaturase
VRVGILYLLSQIGLLTGLVILGEPLWLAVLPALLWAVTMFWFYRLPDDQYHQSRIHPVIPLRWMTIGRLTWITALFAALAWTTLLTGRWAALYFFLLWVVPLFTSFSYFMILRQIVQHGNGGRGWLTNTRVFLVNRAINFAVFPMGQDYHLPHHLYATVPHYRLRALHELLMEYPEYRTQAVVVDGYFRPRHKPPLGPTVLEVVGPEYAPKDGREVYIDNTVLDQDEVEERQAEKERLAAPRE